ncbi:hypothetical protein D3Z46_09535 [Bacteroides sartorii]|nr:hypothetical protein [Phocaeicola sartorii]
MKKYVPSYDKSRKYLEKEKWVADMRSDDKMKNACSLAEKFQGRDSYSEIKQFEKLKNNTKSP